MPLSGSVQLPKRQIHPDTVLTQHCIQCCIRTGSQPVNLEDFTGCTGLGYSVDCWVSLGTVPLTHWIRCWVSLGTVPLTSWIRFGYNTVPVLEPRIRVLKCSSRAEKKHIPGHFLFHKIHIYRVYITRALIKGLDIFE